MNPVGIKILNCHRRGRKFWSKQDEKLVGIFLKDSIPVDQRYTELFRYFVSGFMYYRTDDRANARYPGAPSSHGVEVDRMEGFTRVLPLIGVWVYSGRSPMIETYDDRTIDLREVAKEGLLAGTDRKSPGYWGEMRDYDQRIHEAADVALSIWLLRKAIWRDLSDSEKEKIASWLLGVNENRIVDNNWHHVPLLVNTVLKSLGYAIAESSVCEHYERLKSFYRGSGWFSDGPDQIFDYYNAWGIHYTLFWLDTIDPGLDSGFINKVLDDFVGNYKYFFSPEGVPIMGRSVFYRMAIPAPLIAAHIKDPVRINPGMARRALDCIWKHFIGKGALAKGAVTQGYWKTDLRFVEHYSGPASPLWALRSLIVAFLCPWESDFWRSPEQPLPVERADYEIFVPEIRWKISGRKDTREVQIIILDNMNKEEGAVKNYTWLRKLSGYLRRRPCRPNNRLYAYGLSRYSSHDPFCEKSGGGC